MNSKDRLAFELYTIGLRELGDKAAAGAYHDYLNTLGGPDLGLQFALLEASAGGNMGANELRLRYIDGEFDMTHEEREDWMRNRVH